MVQKRPVVGDGWSPLPVVRKKDFVEGYALPSTPPVERYGAGFALYTSLEHIYGAEGLSPAQERHG